MKSTVYIESTIVEEIRRIRLNIEAECDNDFDKIFARAIETQKKLSNRVVSQPSSKSKSKWRNEILTSVDDVQESTVQAQVAE